jgi:hypothetical protein
MIDLKEQLFRRDLDDEEFDALGKELEASPEACLELAQRAEAAYLATGLPQPRLGHGRRARGLLWGLGGVALLAGLGAWACLPGEDQESSMALLPQAEYRQVAAKAPASALRQAPAQAKALATLDAQVDRPAELLWVTVRNPSPSQARIRLLDMKGAVLAVLHDGSLEKGDHNFSWDGRAMAPGNYRLEFSCNGVVQTRMIKVKMN